MLLDLPFFFLKTEHLIEIRIEILGIKFLFNLLKKEKSREVFYTLGLPTSVPRAIVIRQEISVYTKSRYQDQTCKQKEEFHPSYNRRILESEVGIVYSLESSFTIK